MTLFKLRAEQQRQLFLIASGVSTAGSFAGITAKGWILMKGGVDPFVLALNFAALSLPSLLVSGPAGCAPTGWAVSGCWCRRNGHC